MKNRFYSTVAAAVILASLSVTASTSITEIEGTGNTMQGCVSAKRDALHDLQFKCRDGRIEGISCSVTDYGQTSHGNLCLASCTAYCITGDQRSSE